MKYTYFVFDNQQVFISADTLEMMRDFLAIRAAMYSSRSSETLTADLKEMLDDFASKNIPEAIYLKTFGAPDKEHYEGIKKAAELGYPNAIYRYGAHLDCGDYWDEDKKQASELFKKAALLGHAQSEWICGIECFYGIGCQPLDKDIALEFIERAARKKYVQALEFLGKGYEEGKELPKDLRKSEFYLSLLDSEDTIDLEG